MRLNPDTPAGVKVYGYIDKELRERLSVQAVAEDRSLANAVRVAIKEWVERKEASNGVHA